MNRTVGNILFVALQIVILWLDLSYGNNRTSPREELQRELEVRRLEDNEPPLVLFWNIFFEKPWPAALEGVHHCGSSWV